MSDSNFDPQGSGLYEADQFFEIQKVMNVNEIANFLKCSTKKIYQMVDLNEIPNKRIGRQIRFHLPDIEEWLKGG
jgi:excisionase family DNA binding protein